ncbi:hypothetical protein SFRURICE_016592 [Spodoptera frugiperda]|uniref:tRNA:m(4)X modification enzyme TRM13 n=1 Tax=Spodoptera frugiperda TaxID=7108 RepID=A0A2H1WUJ5_SPOFR|nr:hypothetical protein SFRURICE_016592 [Spodoptera frugiperda]
MECITQGQCQYFVVRKKRLCRMTVRPGRQYCGEHEPQPPGSECQDDRRIPCPNDPKHTVYVSKLEKHLSICNARAREQPPYIVPNINAPTEGETCVRKPLAQLSRETIMQVIDKINYLYDKHVEGNITTFPEHPIHKTIVEEFSESDRTESSRRHLRQVSALLHLAEEEGLVGAGTCYVELGAGKGHMSYYAWQAWGSQGGAVVLLDRAALRHKRDNKLRAARRLRADLRHVALARLDDVAAAPALLALAKHLCGVATDYALRCVTAEAGAGPRRRGVLLATCCHHRCELAAFLAPGPLQELGITGEEFNVMLGIVSWATCGDGRSRDARNKPDHAGDGGEPAVGEATEPAAVQETVVKEAERVILPQESREAVGRRAKQLLDWLRVLRLRELGFDARLCFYVPVTVSPENVCIVAKKFS